MIMCAHTAISAKSRGRVLWSRVHTALLSRRRMREACGLRACPCVRCERCVIRVTPRESVHKVRRARPRPLRVISPESLFIYILTPPNGSRAVPLRSTVARAPGGTRHPTQFLEVYTLQHRRPAARADATAHTTVALLLPDSSLPSLSLSLCTTRSSRAN